MRCFSSNTPQLAIEVSIAMSNEQRASACVPRSQKSFPAKLSNETTFKMDSILIYTCLRVNQKAHCKRSTLQRDSTPRYTHISSVMYRSNRSFNMPPPRAYPGYLTPLPSRGGGNLIITVFQGVGNLIPML